jgi:hypothetical protein
MIIKMDPNATPNQIEAVLARIDGREHHRSELAGSVMISIPDDDHLEIQEGRDGVVRVLTLPAEMPRRQDKKEVAEFRGPHKPSQAVWPS